MNLNAERLYIIICNETPVHIKRYTNPSMVNPYIIFWWLQSGNDVRKANSMYDIHDSGYPLLPVLMDGYCLAGFPKAWLILPIGRRIS